MNYSLFTVIDHYVAFEGLCFRASRSLCTNELSQLCS